MAARSHVARECAGSSPVHYHSDAIAQHVLQTMLALVQSRGAVPSGSRSMLAWRSR